MKNKYNIGDKKIHAYVETAVGEMCFYPMVIRQIRITENEVSYFADNDSCNDIQEEELYSKQEFLKRVDEFLLGKDK